jgi:hypothetical protein
MLPLFFKVEHQQIPKQQIFCVKEFGNKGDRLGHHSNGI